VVLANRPFAWPSLLDVDQARAACVEPVDDDDPLQGCARLFSAKGGQKDRAEQRTYFNKHSFLPDFHRYFTGFGSQ
jgi:hypothetical protein